MNEDLIKRYIENNLRIAWHYNSQEEEISWEYVKQNKLECFTEKTE